VESPTFVGSEYVSIIPGSTDTALLPQEGEIKSEAKKSIDDLLAEFEVEKTAKKLVQAIQNIGDLTQMLKDPQGPLITSLENINQATQHINQATQHIENVTAGVKTGEGTIGNLLTSTQLLDVIYNRLEKVGHILTDISQASAKTPATVDQVQSSLGDVNEITRGITESVVVLNNILVELEKNLPAIAAILNNAQKGSRDVPEITTSVTRFIREARDGVENVDKVIQSLQNNFLIKPNLPPEPVGENTDAGLRR
jgi:phospholipid/cholesterol/gamma-HCH transport system substrate-binding protein